MVPDSPSFERSPYERPDGLDLLGDEYAPDEEFAQAAAPPEQRVTRRRIGIYALAGLGVVAIAAGAVFGPPFYGVLAQRHTTINTPDSVAGLTLDTSPDAQQTADYLRTAVAAGVTLNTSVAAIYDDPGDKQRTVVFFGGTGSVFYPGRQLRSAFNLLDDRDDGMKGLRSVPTGHYGGEMQCGTSTGDGGDMTACGWADHGSLAVALFPGRTVDQAAPLMRQMRDAMQHR